MVIQIVCIAAALIAPTSFRYLSGPNISVMLQAIPSLGIVALGVGVLMIAGEFDLSVGTASTFVSVVAAMMMNEMSVSVWIASAVAIVLGTLIGALNGLITLQFAMPSFIVTLGGLLFWHGMTFLVHGAQSIGFRPDPVFQFVFGGNLGLVSTSFLWLILCCVGFHMMLQHHRLGNQIFAVGGNLDAATAIGISPRKIKLIAFSIAGAMAAFSGIISATRVNSINPAQGQGIELQAIAACVIGGLALTGGRGGILGNLPRRGADLYDPGRPSSDAGAGFLSRHFRRRADRDRRDLQPGCGRQVSAMNRPIYEVRGVSKRYGNVQALSNLNFHIGAGEVVGLLGDNGAGKSTLIKLMSGIIRPTTARFSSTARRAIVNSRRDSEHIGIETIYQDTALVDTMSIVRNIFMGREIANRWGFLKHRSMREIADRSVAQRYPYQRHR